jgi:hypothetical protein
MQEFYPEMTNLPGRQDKKPGWLDEVDINFEEVLSLKKKAKKQRNSFSSFAANLMLSQEEPDQVEEARKEH